MSIAYYVISPVRDEAQYIEQTIQSMIDQTVRPVEWVIVDDGSKDDTANIIEKHLPSNPWIRLVRRQDRGFRKAGTGVMEAFYEGFNKVSMNSYDYIVKLDGDLTFGSRYFEQCFELFANNLKLGVAGGGIYHYSAGALILEKQPIFHVRGATKIYRKKCWDDIEGLYCTTGWDTLDEVKAQMKGWETRSFNELVVVHHRYTGSADGLWRNYIKNGVASYISGYHPLFMAAKCVGRSFQKPYIIGSVGLLWGYASGYLQRLPQVDDLELIRYLRSQQLRRLFRRKSIWK